MIPSSYLAIAIVGVAFAWLLVVFRSRGAHALAPTRMPKQLPHRTAAVVQSYAVRFQAPDDVSAAALREIEAAFERADKFENALQAIATLNQDTTAQRIARQALGKPWS